MSGTALINRIASGRFPMVRALGIPNFRLFWVGETVSLMGNQFYVMAFPWLVLKLTNSGLALGTLFMTLAIPRAIFMLVGGAVSDKMSPKTVLIVANGVRGSVMAVLAILVSTNLIRMWQLYTMAAIYGTFDAFFFPAYKAFLPRVLNPLNLQAGNALLQGSSEAALSVGPMLVGWAMGLGLTPQTALALDALSFAFSVLTLFLVRTSHASAPAAGTRSGLSRSIRAGISYCLKKDTIWLFLLCMAIVNFATVGPFGLGIAVLAKERFGSAASMGFLFSAMAAGSLLGSILAGAFPGPHKLRTMLVIMAFNTAVGMTLLGILSKLALLAGVLVIMGCINSLTGVIAATMMQNMVAPEMMGRIMSLFILSRRGIAPFSFFFAGLMAPLGVHSLFITCGAMVFFSSAWIFRKYRTFGANVLQEGEYVA